MQSLITVQPTYICTVGMWRLDLHPFVSLWLPRSYIIVLIVKENASEKLKSVRAAKCLNSYGIFLDRFQLKAILVTLSKTSYEENRVF